MGTLYGTKSWMKLSPGTSDDAIMVINPCVFNIHFIASAQQHSYTLA
jgi:hypothetical protein